MKFLLSFTIFFISYFGNAQSTYSKYVTHNNDIFSTIGCVKVKMVIDFKIFKTNYTIETSKVILNKNTSTILSLVVPAGGVINSKSLVIETKNFTLNYPISDNENNFIGTNGLTCCPNEYSSGKLIVVNESVSEISFVIEDTLGN